MDDIQTDVKGVITRVDEVEAKVTRHSSLWQICFGHRFVPRSNVRNAVGQPCYLVPRRAHLTLLEVGEFILA